ncbi:OLC1v1036473C2 [Oldenlandia corymbosa var. corymbosa]|uniref:OLC1v1036473C2 n=1 Tax=Oldenlandia corymbosa var. corymbosa TaxID=529605 RepID=A0AAV1CWJ5_OLDCO|nr:OLC1v1036473C2 [Oldenlandia corymbosa var. corymbosa]
MGQSLNKFGGDEKKISEIGPVIEECYDKFFVNTSDWGMDDFYQAVCLTVEEINKKIGSTQLRVPQKTTLQQAYQGAIWIGMLHMYIEKHHQGKGKALTKEEFQKILQEVILDTGVTGVGAKDTLFYMFAVPVTALFFKQRIIPKAIPNEIFIPGITSATVFLLAKLNKI